MTGSEDLNTTPREEQPSVERVSVANPEIYRENSHRRAQMIIVALLLLISILVILPTPSRIKPVEAENTAVAHLKAQTYNEEGLKVLLKATAISCHFYPGVSYVATKEGVDTTHGVFGGTLEESYLTFKEIDLENGDAMSKGPKGSGKVQVFSTGNTLNFVERTENISIQYTRITPIATPKGIIYFVSSYISWGTDGENQKASLFFGEATILTLKR